MTIRHALALSALLLAACGSGDTDSVEIRDTTAPTQTSAETTAPEPVVATGPWESCETSTVPVFTPTDAQLFDVRSLKRAASAGTVDCFTRGGTYKFRLTDADETVPVAYVMRGPAETVPGRYRLTATFEVADGAPKPAFRIRQASDPQVLMDLYVDPETGMTADRGGVTDMQSSVNGDMIRVAGTFDLNDDAPFRLFILPSIGTDFRRANREGLGAIDITELTFTRLP